MKNISRILFGLCLVLSLHRAVCAEEQRKVWVFGLTYQVFVINGFEDASRALVVHCWSEEDDLGTYALKVGENLHWHFKVRFDGSTLYTCDAGPPDKPSAKHFDAFVAMNEGTTCADSENCYWLASEKGFYFSTDNFTWWKKFDW